MVGVAVPLLNRDEADIFPGDFFECDCLDTESADDIFLAVIELLCCTMLSTEFGTRSIRFIVMGVCAREDDLCARYGR